MLEMRTASERDDVRTLWTLCFDSEDERYFSREYRPEDTLIIAEGEAVLSMLHMLPRTIVEEDRRYRAGYLFGIATHPDHRGKGFAGRLIRKSLQTLISRHFDLAALIPGSTSLNSYYARFGFLLHGLHPFTECDTSKLSSAGFSDIPELARLYDAAFPVRVERTAFDWEGILSEYSVGLRSGGYAVWDERGILESVPVLPEAYGHLPTALIKPLTALGMSNVPYINLLYN